MDRPVNIYWGRMIRVFAEYLRRRRHLTLERRRIRDSHNPMELNEEYFRMLFRVSKDIFQYLCQSLGPTLRKRRISGLSVEKQILVTLRFLAEGGYQRGVGQDFFLSVSQPSVSICIKRVTGAVCSHLLGDWIKFPRCNEEKVISANSFQRLIGFPGVIGAIDCSHIAIVSPKVRENGYRNHKGFHSLNTQMICDSTTRILNVCIYPGSVHDSFIWNYSHAKEEMKTTYENGLGRFFLLGDAGYALEPWLLTPLPNALPGTPEFSYTEAHCKTRSVVERLFGILKARWRCLLRDRVLHYQPAQASKIILTCAVLHNINLFHQIPLPEDEAIMEEGENINLDVEELDEPVAGDRLQIARRIQGAQQPVYVAQDPCNPSPCGPNAQCRDGICTCVPEYRGDPYLGCRPECVLSTDCPRDKACIRQKCADPCPGTCGQNARCEVVNHIPICSCRPGYSGNAFVDCRIYQEPVLTQPCQPSPCGPNSQCREVNNQAVCSCVAGYVGSPPTCRPECVVNSDCSQNEACSNQKCRNPCPGTCGVGARCEVINHNPICSCPARYTGDPFVRCSPIPDTPPPPPVNPCQPSPCGPYAECRVVGDSPSCSCLPEYKGSPPNCRPEYVSNSECPSHLACINQKCRDPCPGSCGANAECRVVSHTPNCVCLPGYQGDPFSQCYVQQEPIVEEKAMPCNPSPCGANAVCREQNGAGSCTCLPEYIGNAYEGCRPECILNSDCASNKACISGKCQDPCPGTCGQNADCQVVNHLPSCTCRPGYVGDPFRYCNLAPREEVPVIVDPCNPSPCGPNAQCRKVNEQAVCSCLPNYVRSPPGCRPECVVNSECPLNRACVNQKCVDPCPGTCGQNAICKVVNHVPICACPEGQTADPFYRCQHIPAPIPVVSEERVNPCYPSPCGPHSQCRNIGGAPSCSCLQGYYGTPPSCRPECTINPECRSNLACIREKCRDPCPGSCGVGAQCSVINHVPICTCQQGYTGDPFISCHVIPQVVETPAADPCFPSPCGSNANCRDGVCTCIPEYLGDPYVGCRPECVINSECPRNKACLRQKCADPCPGTCGQGANCVVSSHVPICSCPPGTSGDSFIICRPFQEPVVTQPCNPSPCGPNSQCRVLNNVTVCSCLPEYVGSPPSCRPECVLNSECNLNQACSNQKCQDPCSGTCGTGARCEVVNHNPICSCPSHMTGNPFVRCYPPAPVEAPPINPCQPSPCGPYAECRVIGDSPSCSCLPEYRGSPPNCRPECVSNSECPSHQACINQKCKDPCPETCGAGAECRVISHTPNCFCPAGFFGDPFVHCRPQPGLREAACT